MPKGVYPRSKHCKRGHVRSPENVGIQKQCRECAREHSLEYRAAHRSELRAYNQVYYASHRDEITVRTRDRRTKHPEYTVWWNMLQRCENPKCNHYVSYGDKGVKVCRRWHNFKLFLADLGPRPSPRYTLSRTADSGPYSPYNCCWGSPAHQKTQRRLKRLLRAAGKRAA